MPKWIIECKFSKGWEIHMEFEDRFDALEEFKELTACSSYNEDGIRLTFIPAEES